MKKSIISLIIIASLSLTACSSNVTNANQSVVPKQQKQSINATLVSTNKPTVTNTSDTQSSNNLQYYFTRANGQPDLQLINAINTANKILNISIYSLTKSNIVDAIIADKNRGIDVKIITDKVESKSKSEAKELALLKNDNIPIK